MAGWQSEKVYVAIGTNKKEGILTLEWALAKWSSYHPISIVLILHEPAANNSSEDYVWTPVGKLPASYVSDEQLEIIRKIKENATNQLLSDYKAVCGEVKAETLKIEKHDHNKPIHKILVDLVSELRITKLVMAVTFLKPSPWKSQGSFYVHRNKPEFCELFFVSGGKLVHMREQNNEGLMVDDQGLVIAKFKEMGSFRDWIEKMLHDGDGATNEKHLRSLPLPSTSNIGIQFQNCVQEIESYFQQLMSSNSDEEGSEPEPDTPENMSAADQTAMLKAKIRGAQNELDRKKKEAKANLERRGRAEWALCLCTRQAEEIEGRINGEIAARVDLQNELDTAKEEASEVRIEVENVRSKLQSISELQRDLSNKLHLSSLAKSRAVAQLEKSASARAEMLREIEQLRTQRDVVQRRIEFCKEKDAIGMANRLTDLEFSHREFTAEEIRTATDNFSERLRLKSAGEWTHVYKGKINHVTVAIKMCDSSVNPLSQEAFQAKVKFVGEIQHPHLVAMIGFCAELKCIVLEYMHKGCLRDALFSSASKSSTGRRHRGLNWHARVRIAAEVCSGLGFLHSAKPRPIAHGKLNPNKILLNRNLVAKLHGFGPVLLQDQPEVQSDIWAVGNLVQQILTGRNWVGLVKDTMVTDRAALARVLDNTAGEWPLNLAEELFGIAMMCLSANKGPGTELKMAVVTREIDNVLSKADDLVARKKADDLAASGQCEAAVGEGASVEGSSDVDVPNMYLCPITQEVMKNPHLAADGYTYELEAIEEWLNTGHNTSPMTNVKLKHKLLTPNHALRSVIEEWHSTRKS